MFHNHIGSIDRHARPAGTGRRHYGISHVADDELRVSTTTVLGLYFTMAPLPKMITKVQAILDHWRFVTTMSALDLHRMLGNIQYMALFVLRGRLRFQPPVVSYWHMGPDIGRLGTTHLRPGLGNLTAGMVGFPAVCQVCCSELMIPI